jgi:hypothetical protein
LRNTAAVTPRPSAVEDFQATPAFQPMPVSQEMPVFRGLADLPDLRRRFGMALHSAWDFAARARRTTQTADF